jgi:putative FmdB family regulatory protein
MKYHLTMHGKNNMPTYEYRHSIETCQHEWEEVRSIKDPDPTQCPKCLVDGNIIHLISGGSGKGIVELYGDELIAKAKADGKKIAKDAAQSEKLYANLLGEDKMQSLQQRLDRQKQEKHR